MMDNQGFDQSGSLAARLRERRDRMAAAATRGVAQQGSGAGSQEQGHGQGHGAGAVEGHVYGGASLSHAAQARDWTPDEQAAGREEAAMKKRFADLDRNYAARERQAEKRDTVPGRRFTDLISSVLAAERREAEAAQPEVPQQQVTQQRRPGMRM